MHKLIMVGVVVAVAASAALPTHGTVVCSCDSSPLLIDTRTGVRDSTGDETLTYSSLWDGGDGATVTIAQNGEALVEGLTGEGERAWSAPSDGTYVLTHTTYTNGVAGKVESATFEVTGKGVPFAPADVTVSSYSNKYDGVAHGISVTVASGIAGAVVKYSVGGAQFTATGTDAQERVPPEFVDVGEYTVWCEIAAPGYITQTNSATVTITKREVTLTSGSGSKVYDGTALTKHEVAISGDGFAAGEGASYNFTGLQTTVGESENTFTYALNDGTKAGNYEITTVNGTLIVTKATVGPGGGGGSGVEEPGGGAVPVGGESKFDMTFMYGGEGHTIDTNALTAAFGAAMIGEGAVEYALDDGTGSGGVGHAALPWGTVPVYTNVGEYVVWYRVTNPNYNDFVRAAKVTITNRPVTVTSGDGSWTYDGQAHSNDTVEAEGFVDGEGIVADNFATITDVGSVANSFDYAFADGTIAENYAVTCVTGTLTVASAGMDGWTDETKWSVTLSGDGAKYGGTEKTCEVTALSYDGFAIPTFMVAGNTAMDAGDYTLTVTGTGNFSGSHTFPWSIAKRAVTLTSGSDSKVYDGIALTKHEVAVGGDGFAAGEGATYFHVGSQTSAGTSANGFTYTLNSNTKADNYEISTANGTLTVTKADNGWVAQPSIAGWTYGQAASMPDMGAARFGTVQVAYSAPPQNAGNYTATFTVAGTANYAGLSKAVQFTIARATYDMSGARWSAGAFTYDGTEKSVIVEGLPSGVSVASYANNAKTAAGSYTATAALSYDTTNFNAPSIAPCSWSIARRDIAGATVTLGPTPVYNGAEQEQAVTGVKIGGLDATYTVTGNRATDVGTYTLTVTGTGNFTGTATKQWRIRSGGIVESVVPYDGVYDGEGHGIEVSVTKPDGAVVRYAHAADGPYSEDAVLFTNVTDGAVAVWYTVEAENYTSITNFGTVKISPKALTDDMVTLEAASYAYDGTAKEPAVTVSDGEPSILTEDDYEVSYSDNVNAGVDTAKATVTGKGNYTGTVTKSFSIAKAEVDAPGSVAGKAYTGGLLRADVSATARYTVANEGGVNVGSYPVVLTLTDAANYRWKGGDSNPLSLTFTISKAANSWTKKPSIAGWTYGQAASVPDMGAARFGSASVTYSATPQNAGAYTATFTVPETANYAGLSKTVQFTIARATYDMSGARWDYTGAFVYDGGTKTVLVVGLPLGVSVASYSGNSATVPGGYVAHATLAYDARNYDEPAVADLSWAIRSDEGDRLKEAFDGLPAAVEPDGKGGWKVTVTNDIGGAGLPIEIPDNVGDVTIDLVGHDLTGADGAAGDDSTPGGDGKPVIVVVPGSGDGDATRLSIVTTGGDAVVRSGSGGDGVQGGDGAPAVSVADGARDGVEVDVGEGVTVRGGDGGSSADGRGGAGGVGIDGNVGTNDGVVGGGSGGGSANGKRGDDGKAVDGTVGGGSGTVVKARVPVPVIAPVAWTGYAVSPTVPASALYTAAPASGIAPGSYTVALTLVDGFSYEWVPRDGAAVAGAVATTSFTILDPPSCTVTFDANGGSVPTASKTVTYGSPYGDLPKAVLDGQVLVGWFTSAAGGAQVTAETRVETVAAHTLYAHWRDPVPGTVVLTTERTAAGGVMRMTLHRTGGGDGRIAVKAKTQTSTGICGTDFDYVKQIFVWEDGDTADKVLEIPTYATGAGKILRVKLSTLTQGAYKGCVAPTLAESKVYAEIEVPIPGTVTVTAPTSLSVVGGNVLRMTLSRTGGSDGRIAVKAKTQTSTALMGVGGSADFDYVKKVFEWADGDATDRYLDIPTYVQPWEGTRALRVKLATLATGAYAGNLVPKLAEAKIYADIENPSRFGTVSVAPSVAQPRAGEPLRLVFRRTGGSDWPIAVKYKVQTSTALAGTDFEYAKGVVTWADGEGGEKAVEVTTYPSAAGKQLRVKLSTLTQGAYEGCVTPHVKEAKVYVPLW